MQISIRTNFDRNQTCFCGLEIVIGQRLQSRSRAINYFSTYTRLPEWGATTSQTASKITNIKFEERTGPELPE
jgi:hypothetical protein